jgi:hypothetical protein
MNGEALKILHDDVKSLTEETKEMLVTVGVMMTKLEIYVDDTKDQETRLRRLERGEKIIWGIGSILVTLATWGDDIRAWFSKLW